MWEVIGSSFGIVIGAVVLFAAFTAILFIYERRTEKNRPRRHKKRAPYVVPPAKKDKAA